MSETSSGPNRYQVVYSEFVRNELKRLIARVEERGIGAQVRAAAREMDRRLRIFPQFGDLLADLLLAPGELRIGTVPPLVVKFALYDDRRLVIVSAPIATLPRSGL